VSKGRADLEQMLREAPDDDTLSIYADALMAEGDPRGELIALEMKKPERRELLMRWLASHLKLEPGGDHLFVADERFIPGYLDEPIGDFVRGVSAAVRMEDARKIVDAIVQRPRPFMTRFKLAAGFEGPLVMDHNHVRAMPNLVEMDIDGDYDLRAFRHPSVKKLMRRSWSLNGLASWVLDLDLPNCEELLVDPKPWSTNVDPAKVRFEGLPRLRVLDISECEPQFIGPKMSKERTNLDVFRWLHGLPWLEKLEKLRVPSVRTRQQADLLAKIAKRVPHIEIVRTYSRCAAGLELASDKVRFAPPWPWLPDDMQHDHWKYKLSAPGGITVDMLSGAIGSGLERTFDQGTEQYREDWRTIWRALDTCSRWFSKKLEWGLVLRAFEGFPTEDIGSATSLRNEIVGLRGRIKPDAMVSVAPK